MTIQREKAVGTVFLVCGGSFAFAGAPHGPNGLLAVIAVAIALIVPGMWLVERYYAATFGRIVQPERSQDLWRVAVIAIGTTIGNIGPLSSGLVIGGAVTERYRELQGLRGVLSRIALS